MSDRIVTVSATIPAPPETLFEILATPRRHAEIDGSGTVQGTTSGPERLSLGSTFGMSMRRVAPYRITSKVVEFEEGRRIAWRPSEQGKKQPGHLWRWELEPIDDGRTRVTHTYDWTELTDQNRVKRARATTSERLQASIDRLKDVAES